MNKRRNLQSLKVCRRPSGIWSLEQDLEPPPCSFATLPPSWDHTCSGVRCSAVRCSAGPAVHHAPDVNCPWSDGQGWDIKAPWKRALQEKRGSLDGLCYLSVTGAFSVFITHSSSSPQQPSAAADTVHLSAGRYLRRVCIYTGSWPDYINNKMCVCYWAKFTIKWILEWKSFSSL